jgi:Uma2 family endonuclease
MVETVTRYRFTVDEYHRMVEAGILTEDDPVELLYGELVVMAPISIHHAFCVDRLMMVFAALLPRAHPRVQNPVTLPTESEPEPDFVLARARSRGYADRHPGPSDILLVVEVAETSQAVDRKVKAPLYAEQGIPEYWIVDIPKGRIEVHREPEEGAWTSRTSAGRGETLSPLAFPDFTVAVEDLLP